MLPYQQAILHLRLQEILYLGAIKIPNSSSETQAASKICRKASPLALVGCCGRMRQYVVLALREPPDPLAGGPLQSPKALTQLRRPVPQMRKIGQQISARAAAAGGKLPRRHIAKAGNDDRDHRGATGITGETSARRLAAARETLIPVNGGPDRLPPASNRASVMAAQRGGNRAVGQDGRLRVTHATIRQPREVLTRFA